MFTSCTPGWGLNVFGSFSGQQNAYAHPKWKTGPSIGWGTCQSERISVEFHYAAAAPPSSALSELHGWANHIPLKTLFTRLSLIASYYLRHHLELYVCFLHHGIRLDKTFIVVGVLLFVLVIVVHSEWEHARHPWITMRSVILCMSIHVFCMWW